MSYFTYTEWEINTSRPPEHFSATTWPDRDTKTQSSIKVDTKRTNIHLTTYYLKRGTGFHFSILPVNNIKPPPTASSHNATGYTLASFACKSTAKWSMSVYHVSLHKCEVTKNNLQIQRMKKEMRERERELEKSRWIFDWTDKQLFVSCFTCLHRKKVGLKLCPSQLKMLSVTVFRLTCYRPQIKHSPSVQIHNYMWVLLSRV